MMHYFNKLVDLFTLKDARTSKESLILRDDIFMFSTHLMSNQGLQFTRQKIADLCKYWGLIQKLTMVYCPVKPTQPRGSI